MPLKARARSANAVRRDGEILDASVAEIVESGLDGTGMLAVARRCGLAAGSVYSRHETIGELQVEVWEQRAKAETLSFVSDLMSIARGESTDVTDRILRPSDELRVGIECLALSHRLIELQEVVRPALDEVLGFDELDDVRRARIAYAVGYGIGTLIRHQVTAIDAGLIKFSLGAITTAMKGSAPVLTNDWNPSPGDMVRSNTGEQLRDALIDGALTVIGQVGLANATVSRIGRRAGLTAGAVYTGYPSKDDLLIDALRVLLTEAISSNQGLTDRAADPVRMADASAALLVRAAGPVRRPWLRFRLEAYVAALHRRDLAAVLDEIHAENSARYDRMLAPTEAPKVLVDAVAVAGQAIPLGLSILDESIDGLDRLDYRNVTEPLFGHLTGTVQGL